MDINETLTELNKEIKETMVKLGAKSREQAAMLSRLGDVSEEIVYLSAILNGYEDDRKRLEAIKRINDSEKKLTDSDCIMLKIGVSNT